MIRVPAFLGQAKDGHAVVIKRQSISFETGIPVITDFEIEGRITGLQTIKQIPHPYIAGWLTDADGHKHEIKSRPDQHIFIVHPELADDEVAMTIGDPAAWQSPLADDEGLVCRMCFRKDDLFCAGFREMDLEPNEACKRCGTVLAGAGLQLDFDEYQPLEVGQQVDSDAATGQITSIDGVGEKSIVVTIDWGVDQGGAQRYSLGELIEHGFSFGPTN